MSSARLRAGAVDPIDRASPSDLLQLAVDRGPVPWQVGALLVTDRPLDAAAVRRALADRVRSVPRLRRRLVRTPPLCGRPVWVDDPGFAVGRHVSEARCPPPGDEAALLDIAVRSVGTRLPLDHPAWGAVVVTGLAGDRGAVVLVVHHVLADGVGGLAALARLLDDAPPDEHDPFPRRPPAPHRLFADALAARVRAATHLARGLRRVRDAAGELRAARAPRAPRSSLNGPVGARRALRVVRADLSAVRAAAHRHGGTVNDVVLAAVAGAVGHLLGGRGDGAGEIVVSVPVSSRRRTDAGRLGNAVGAQPVSVPTTGTPHTRLATVARRTAGRRSAPRGASAFLLDAAFRAVAATGALPWLLARQRLVTTFVTDLRGPGAPVAFLGARVREIVPVVSTTGNVPVVVAALSYAGTLALAVVADPEACPELDALATDLGAELEALCRSGDGPDGDERRPGPAGT
ncbi:wax ester/triacylglycerol synthase domain-containing protein [Pseudonocardia endophytica]|uniref:diacylglycerol O-acyltransferase n=1 Tax=Pseudonocardia endophytica TaxID=401976 RepID=A0A4V2PI02_PSEEN|nr:wax ester/triacylglycerol synthase domain-containing protein [Pseudonocardia endophytica]TCK22746.1 WS/DGAT/MGAT family acyltransferase [Pseudonocardia endophytica]